MLDHQVWINTTRFEICVLYITVDAGLKAGIITSVLLATMILSAVIFILVRYLLRVRARFRDVSGHQPHIAIPMSRLPEGSSLFSRYKPTRVSVF